MMQLVHDIFVRLTARGETLAVAESCTGGGLANEITLMPGVSQIFLGSITAYANEAKVALLQIPQEVLAQEGAVSEAVAILLAEHCRRIVQSTWALSTTGIAGPTGASPNKPVGLVWIGLAGPNQKHAQCFNFAPCTRLEHRGKTINAALHMLSLALKH